MLAQDQRKPDISMAGKIWYFGSISRHIAEELLTNSGNVGDYLIRHSESNVNDYSLSVKSTSGGIAHFKIQQTVNGMWHIGNVSAPFHTIEEFLESYKSKPIRRTSEGVETILSSPFTNVSKGEFHEYEEIRPLHYSANSQEPSYQSVLPLAAAERDKNYQQLPEKQESFKKNILKKMSSRSPSQYQQSSSCSHQPLPLPLPPTSSSLSSNPSQATDSIYLQPLSTVEMSKYSLSKVLPDDIAQILKCPICLDILSKPIRMLYCGHNFCELCLKRKAINHLIMWEQRYYYRCPVCSTNTGLAYSDNVEDVARNYTLEDLMEKEICATRWK